MLESGYRALLQQGADLIETDIPAQLGPLLFGATRAPLSAAIPNRVIPTRTRTIQTQPRPLGAEQTGRCGLFCCLPSDLEQDLVRLACTLCLLGNDPTILEPDVLSKDRAKWEASKDPRLVDRAHRRGKKGWLVGAHIEVIPHVRRPHPALVWTGKGRAVPRIVMRKGSIVHRNVVERVPTGHASFP